MSKVPLLVERLAVAEYQRDLDTELDFEELPPRQQQEVVRQLLRLLGLSIVRAPYTTQEVSLVWKESR